MRQATLHTTAQQSATAKIISLPRAAAPAVPVKSAPAIDPRSRHFTNSNGARWGRELRSK